MKVSKECYLLGQKQSANFQGNPLCQATKQPNQTKPFSAKPLLLAMHRASEGHFSSYTWRKTWLPAQHISHYNSRRKGEVGEMVEENMSTCTVYLSL